MVDVPESLVARAHAFLADPREPVDPRDAATVVLLRDRAAGAGRAAGMGGVVGVGGDVGGEVGGGGLEVYLLRRAGTMAFAAGMHVFPGGSVDPRDGDAGTAWAGPSPAEWGRRLGCEDQLARALVCAAVRETFEESGVLLAGTSETNVVADTTADDWEAERVALESRELSLTDFLNRRGLVLRTDLLGVWDAWLTPIFEPKRYRTWFFVALLPSGQITRDVSTESSSVEWIPARVAAEQADAGDLALMPPTYLTSMEVGEHSSPEEVLAVAGSRSVEMFTPSVEPLGEGWTLSMPDRLRPLVAARRRA